MTFEPILILRKSQAFFLLGGLCVQCNLFIRGAYIENRR